MQNVNIKMKNDSAKSKMLDFIKPEKYKIILAVILFIIAPFPLFMNIDDFGSQWSFTPSAAPLALFTSIGELSYSFLDYEIDLKLLALCYVAVAYLVSCVIVLIYRKHRSYQNNLDSLSIRRADRFRGMPKE